MIRIAAMADVHFGPDAVNTLRPYVDNLDAQADLLLIAGDLTRTGVPEEAMYLLNEFKGVDLPIVSVLGNHDYHADRNHEIAEALRERGVRVLDGDGTTLDINDACVGVAGTKGFGGGFVGACASDFGEPEAKAFVRHSKRLAVQLEESLSSLECDLRIALTHYSPIPETLEGERLEIFPFLGSYFLAEAVDRGGAHFALHGHAHAGREAGVTPGGVQVRNVAQPVIKRAYALYYFDNIGGAPVDAPQSEFAGWRYLAH
jgi:Icc-related predicted phosphoesterase